MNTTHSPGTALGGGDGLERRYRAAREYHDCSWWLLATVRTAQDATEVTSHSACWVGQIAQSYNAEGPRI